MGVREQERRGSDVPPETDAAERARFHAGEHTAACELLGAHPRRRSAVDGYRFCVWAPHAQRVSVVGDFNGWDAGRDPLYRHDDGIWEGFVPGARAGQHYKFELIDGWGHRRLKTDPFARASEYRPATASLTVADSAFAWSDADWLAHRPDWQQAPLSIYEVHAGSWQRDTDGSFLGYREIGRRLADYASDLGFTHVELLPLLEHPFDGSWGYQATGWFSPTRRFGEPDDLRAMIDHLHARGIGVILDWVPGHFPRDDHGLALFDGTPLFEPADSLRADMPDWGTLAFDHGRPEIRSFLISSALYWLREFHIDGLRVDAVASMIYLDYGRGPGRWRPNRHGGRENLEAEAFLQQFNSATHGKG